MKKSKYWHFSKGVNPWFFSKMSIFPPLFYGNIGQENVFCDILEPKNAFLGYKNNKFKTSRNWHFSKGVSPWFCSKNDHFSNFFFFGNIGKENVFYDILERKNAFLRYKNQMLKKSKNSHFSKGVNPLLLVHKWPVLHLFFFGNIGQENVFYNMAIFQTFFLSQYTPRTCLLRYSRTRKRLSRL